MLTDPMFWTIIAALACVVIGLWIGKPPTYSTSNERMVHRCLSIACPVVIVAVIVSEALA